jgi:hypothetical protein
MRAVSAAAVLMVLLMASCRSVPDSVMLQNFQQHKSALDELAMMATRDKLGCPIPATGEAPCVSPARLAQYQAILKSARVFAVSPQWDHGCILFPSVQESALLAMHSHARGYAYSTRATLVPSTQDTAGEIGERSMAFKPIHEPWYLYFSA